MRAIGNDGIFAVTTTVDIAGEFSQADGDEHIDRNRSPEDKPAIGRFHENRHPTTTIE
jgi:hypothetical protein